MADSARNSQPLESDTVCAAVAHFGPRVTQCVQLGGGGVTEAADDAGSQGDEAAVVVFDPLPEGGLGGTQDGLVQEDGVQHPRHPREAGAARPSRCVSPGLTVWP